MRTKYVSIGLLALLAVSSSVALISGDLGGDANAATASSPCAQMTTTTRHVINPTNQSALWTPSLREATNAASTYGYTSTASALRTSLTLQNGLVEARRGFGAKGFVLSVGAIPTGFTAQTAKVYVSPKPLSCTVPVYEFWRNGVQRLGWSAVDVRAMQNAGWTYSRVAFHAVPGTTQRPAAPPTPATQPTPTATTTAPTTTAPTTLPSTPTPTTSTTTAPTTPALTKFQIAVIPDTQREMHTWKQGDTTRFRNRIDYIVNQAPSRNLAYVLHVGDLVDWDTPTHDQYELGDSGLKALEAAGIPWAGTIGNHDTAATCLGGSACPGTDVRVTIRQTETYNKYFGVNRFPTLAGTFEPGKIDNAYRKFTAGGLQWMVVNLELYPRQEAVDWANQVVKANPKHNVILLTHSYLDGNGAISNYNEVYGKLTPLEVHNQLVVPNANIKQVLSGHSFPASVNESKNTAGSKISADMMGLWENDQNPVMFMTIDPAAGTIQREVISPKWNKRYPEYEKTTTGMTFIR